ncbi:MAG: amidohydrolase/deacetylase family metallohydrolase [Bryobacterales bacterium]|nr:amidohydrolase/deacetylase family metallohydrolase [Bryobacterales bacterium]
MRLLVLFALLAAALPAQTYSLLLKGGHLIDPKNNIDAIRDIAIQDGKVAAVATNIPGAQARRVIELNGLYVTPGLIDIHAHVFSTTGIPGAWAGDNSVQADTLSFRTGVTTLCDAGSSGWRNFEDFRQTVIDRADTRVLAFINIAGFGMISDMTEQGDFNPKELARLALKHKDVVVGVKSAHYQLPDWKSIDNAIAAGKAANIPIMVDFGYFLRERPFWQLVTECLRPGDIATHMFRGPVPWIDENGKIYDYVRRARARGVRFDVGHGGGSFVMRTAVPTIKQGFYPDSISTDLHTGSMNAQMQDMPTTISKMMAMGMPYGEAVRASTWTPAQMISQPELGHLTVGATADIAVWQVLKGEFGFADASGAGIKGSQRLLCDMTLRAGRIVWNYNGRGAQPYDQLPKTYGVREGIDFVIPPPK